MRVIPTSAAALLNQPLDDGRTDRPWTLNGCDNDDDEIRKKYNVDDDDDDDDVVVFFFYPPRFNKN